MKVNSATNQQGLRKINTMKTKWDQEYKDSLDNIPSWEYVILDMKERNLVGREKYSKFLTPNTDEDMLQHLYEELLDAAVYIKTLIIQRSNDV